MLGKQVIADGLQKLLVWKELRQKSKEAIIVQHDQGKNRQDWGGRAQSTMGTNWRGAYRVGLGEVEVKQSLPEGVLS